MGLDIKFALVSKSLIEGKLRVKDTALFEGEPDRMRSYVDNMPADDQCIAVKEHRGYLEDPIHAIVLELFGFWDKGCGWVLNLDDLFALDKAIKAETAKDKEFRRFDCRRTTDYLADLLYLIEVIDDENECVLFNWC